MRSSPDIISPDIAPTLSGLFTERIARTPDNIAYRYCNKLQNTWHTLSWKQMQEKVAIWRAALMQEELQPGDRIALMLPNCPEWVCLDQAALSLGLIVVPLYVNDRPENVAYILEDTGAKLFLCPGLTCWEHLAPVFNRLSGLNRIVTIDFCQPKTEDSRVTCISDWLPTSGVETSPHTPQPDDTATIVYTSGTTGPPKGVMLSHNNIISNAWAGSQCMDIYRDDLFLSFLPLSHMLERTAGYYLPLMAGATVAFARSIPELAEDLVYIKPTVMVAVPRIFERVHANIQEKIRTGSPLLRRLFHEAVEAGWHRFEYNQGRAGRHPSFFLHPLLDAIVARKIRARLGGRLRIIISGGAALSTDIARFFISLGLPIYQGYGLTETSPVISVNRIEENNPAGVGLVLPGIEVRIGDRRELLVRGDCVMQGYWNRPDATREVIDPEGWLHTGDTADVVDEHIRITGRLKEVIVLSNGEKVSPTDVEMAIAADPLFEQSMVIGEGRPFLTLITVLSSERWALLAEELGVPENKDSLQLKTVKEAVLKRCEALMYNFPGYAFIRQVVLSLEPWTIEEGLLTPTMKVRRKNVLDKMKEEIDTVYSS